jgi:hypothetical protein
VVEAAPFADATVYGVSARGRDDPSNEFLRRLSEKTGGRTLEALESTDLRQRFLEVLRDIRGRYVISYAPEGVGEGGWHRVEVKLVRRRGDVLARPGYLRPASSPRAASPGSGRP